MEPGHPPSGLAHVPSHLAPERPPPAAAWARRWAAMLAFAANVDGEAPLLSDLAFRVPSQAALARAAGPARKKAWRKHEKTVPSLQPFLRGLSASPAKDSPPQSSVETHSGDSHPPEGRLATVISTSL